MNYGCTHLTTETTGKKKQKIEGKEIVKVPSEVFFKTIKI